MARIRVLLDACVLVPYQLADLLLRLADAELFEPLWSEDILIEVERTLVRLGVPAEKAQRRIGQMQAAFPNATVTHYQDLIQAMETDPKDRHVAAAAVRGGAALIVTINLRDFPAEALQSYDIEPTHPDGFLQDQLELSEGVVLGCLQEQRAAYSRPSMTLTDFYLSLANTVPTFAAVAGAAERRQRGWSPDDPLPIEVVDEGAALRGMFPDGPPTPADARGAAFLWWVALTDRAEYSDMLRHLTWNPPAWGDFDWADQLLSGHGLMQIIEKCPGDEEIVYAKFMPNVTHAMRGFAEAPVNDVKILTLVRCEDGLWRAWGLSESYFPQASEVRGT